MMGQAPSSCHFISWADPAVGLRGAGWIGLAERTSLCSGGVEQTRKPALSPSCTFCQDGGQLLGAAKSAEEGVSGRSDSSAAEDPGRGSSSSPPQVSVSPGACFLGLTRTVSEQSAGSEGACFSGGSATLGSGRKEADRGCARASKVAKGVLQEVTSSQLASGPALGKHVASSKVTPARSWSRTRGVCAAQWEPSACQDHVPAALSSSPHGVLIVVLEASTRLEEMSKVTSVPQVRAKVGAISK